MEDWEVPSGKCPENEPSHIGLNDGVQAPCPVCRLFDGFHDTQAHSEHVVPRECILPNGWLKAWQEEEKERLAASVALMAEMSVEELEELGGFEEPSQPVRNFVMSFRVTAAEHDMLKVVSDLQGVTLSDFIRSSTINVAERLIVQRVEAT